MRKSLTLVVASVASLLAADLAMAQPRPYGEAWRQPPPPQAPRDQHRHDDHGPQAQTYYYNGRWIGQDEWGRRSSERERWARTYERRHRDRDKDDSAAIIAGIIGFALGAAIVGSQQDADHARSADRSWDDYCARKYRSYDRRSRTYMGTDGLRHYCQ
jgi:hypothetical protein